MILSSLCYLEQDGSVLMLHRVKKQHDINHDKWIGIGGKFEEKESPEDCMLREFREETGLTLMRYRFCGIVTFISDLYETEYMHLFSSDEYTGTILDSCPEGRLEWITWDQLEELPQWEGDRIFLKLLRSKAPFFSLKLEYGGDKLLNAILNGEQIYSVAKEK